MGAEHVRSLQIGDQRLSIVSEEPDLLGGIEEVSIARSEAEQLPLLGFKIFRPTTGRRLWTLVGMDSCVLARSKQAEPVMEVLDRHLGGGTCRRPRRQSLLRRL